MDFLKRLAIGSLVFAASILIALLAAEVFLRFFFPQPTAPVLFSFDKDRGSIPIPNQSAWRSLPGVYEFKFSNNSLGLRGSKEYQENKSTKYRILMLGDSFTYGLGVNDDETYPFFVEKNLPNTEVINLGNSGKGNDYMLRAYTSLGARFKSDVVALGFFGNDFYDNELGKYYSVNEGKLNPLDLTQSDFAKKSWQGWPTYSWLIEHSHLVNLIRQAIIGQSIQAPSNPADNESANEKNIPLTALYLQSISDAVKKENTPFVVFYIPRKEDVEAYRNGVKMRKDETAFSNIMKEKGIENFSLTPALAKTAFHIDDLYLAEGHLKVEGNRIVAEEIAKRLSEKLVGFGK